MRSEKSSTRRGTFWLAASLALIPALAKLFCYPRNIGSDDAYIHLQVATNFVHGLGWGINPHQPVNLSTSPAFTLLLAAMVSITQHAILVTQILSAGAVVAGLLLIFFVVSSETGSVHAALFAEFAAAFAVNLWRWNGSLMEATFGFATVAATLYLFRKDASNSPLRLFLGGIVLGLGVLLRPEMGIVVVLALFVQWMRSAADARLKDTAIILLGVVLPVASWCLFAWRNLGSVIPTTLAAKSTSHLILFNGVILRQFAESVFESILFPTMLILLLAFVTRGKYFDFSERRNWLTYVIPVGWVAGLVGFYYLKMTGLQSAGRYLLPLLPCQAVVLGLLWAGLEVHLKHWQKRLAVVFIALQVVFSVELNYKVVMPALQRFDSNYGATMRAAAEELAKSTQGKPNPRVLVETDIGILSYAGRGRFEIYDGGALATPSLRGLTVRDQIAQSQPAYLVESLASTPDGMGPEFPGLLRQIWERRFRQHSVRVTRPYYYTIIYQVAALARPVRSIARLP